VSAPNALDIKAKLAAARARSGGNTVAVSGPAGITPLADLSADRSSFLLIGPPGVGKSVAAASFGGDDIARAHAKLMGDPEYVLPAYGRVLYMLAEHGQEGGAGGSTPLKYLAQQTGVLEADVDVLKVTSWAHAQVQKAWVVDNVRMLFEERKIRVLVVDGITEIAMMVEQALSRINPVEIGADKSGQREAVNAIVRDIDGRTGRQMEKADFGRILRLVHGFGATLKFLPFRVVTTALAGDMYDSVRYTEDSRPIAIGADLPGKKVVARVHAQADFVFHVEREVRWEGEPKRKLEQYKFLTSNDPSAKTTGPKNWNFAKTRAGYSLETWVPASGRGVLKALGYAPLPLDAPLPSAASVAEMVKEIEA
jgi:hypothetical protein